MDFGLFVCENIVSFGDGLVVVIMFVVVIVILMVGVNLLIDGLLYCGCCKGVVGVVGGY